MLNLGGDHSCATGSIAGMRSVYGKKFKIIWVDAHADINSMSSSCSLNYHGMPVGHLLGFMEKNTVPGFDWLDTPVITPKDIVYIGLRDMDYWEVDRLKNNDIKCFDMDKVTELGIGNVMKQTFEYLGAEDNPIFCSFDVDGCDPSYINQTGTISRGGLSEREANYILRSTASTGRLVGLDMVEVNPLINKDQKPRKFEFGDWKEITGTPTVCHALEMIRSALGYKYI